MRIPRTRLRLLLLLVVVKMAVIVVMNLELPVSKQHCFQEIARIFERLGQPEAMAAAILMAADDAAGFYRPSPSYLGDGFTPYSDVQREQKPQHHPAPALNLSVPLE